MKKFISRTIKCIMIISILISFSIGFIGCGKSMPSCDDNTVTDTALRIIKKHITKKISCAVINNAYGWFICSTNNVDKLIQEMKECKNNPKCNHRDKAITALNQIKTVNDKLKKITSLEISQIVPTDKDEKLLKVSCKAKLTNTKTGDSSDLLYDAQTTSNGDVLVTVYDIDSL